MTYGEFSTREGSEDDHGGSIMSRKEWPLSCSSPAPQHGKMGCPQKQDSWKALPHVTMMDANGTVLGTALRMSSLPSISFTVAQGGLSCYDFHFAYGEIKVQEENRPGQVIPATNGKAKLQIQRAQCWPPLNKQLNRGRYLLVWWLTNDPFFLYWFKSSSLGCDLHADPLLTTLDEAGTHSRGNLGPVLSSISGYHLERRR